MNGKTPRQLEAAAKKAAAYAAEEATQKADAGTVEAMANNINRMLNEKDSEEINQEAEFHDLVHQLNALVVEWQNNEELTEQMAKDLQEIINFEAIILIVSNTKNAQEARDILIRNWNAKWREIEIALQNTKDNYLSSEHKIDPTIVHSIIDDINSEMEEYKKTKWYLSNERKANVEHLTTTIQAISTKLLSDKITPAQGIQRILSVTRAVAAAAKTDSFRESSALSNRLAEIKVPDIAEERDPFQDLLNSIEAHIKHYLAQRSHWYSLSIDQQRKDTIASLGRVIRASRDEPLESDEKLTSKEETVVKNIKEEKDESKKAKLFLEFSDQKKAGVKADAKRKGRSTTLVTFLDKATEKTRKEIKTEESPSSPTANTSGSIDMKYTASRFNRT